MEEYAENSGGVTVEKGELRAAMRVRRASLRVDWLRRAGPRAQQWLMAHRWWKNAGTVAVYWPLPGEVRVDHLVAAAGSRRLVLPRCDGHDLTWHAWSPGDTLVPGQFRLSEPPTSAPLVDPGEVDLFVVPGLAFDREGGRLGHGKAYYDTALAGRRGRAVGLAWSIQVVDRVPMEPHDVRVDGVVTEEGWALGGGVSPRSGAALSDDAG